MPREISFNNMINIPFAIGALIIGLIAITNFKNYPNRLIQWQLKSKFLNPDGYKLAQTPYIYRPEHKALRIITGLILIAASFIMLYTLFLKPS